MTGRGNDERGHSPLEGLGAPRRGAHRTGGGLGAILTSLAAVVAVVALLGGLFLAFGKDDSTPTVPTTASDGPAATPTPSASASEPAVVPSAEVPAPSAEPSGDGSETPSETPSPDAGGASAVPGTSEGPGAGDEEGLQAIPVVVLNQSGRAGLAGRTADDLRAAGWTVSSVGNFRGTVPSTTVYYPEGGEAAAQVLAELLPGADRIRPSFSGVSSSKLTVVLV